jgi:S1-C subfamily serine protease
VADDGRELPKWAGRLLPRSVLGLAGLLLAASIGAAFSGAVLYAYYDYRLDRTDSRAEEYASTFADRLQDALDTIDVEREEAKAEVRAELEPLQQVAAGGETIARLLEDVAPSVWFVSTLAEDGSPSVGTAFVVFSDPNQSFLLTSYTTVRASTAAPGPGVSLRKGDESLDADLVTWDEQRDLALVSVDRGDLPRLAWATGDPPAAVGERIFAVSGLGSAGGSVSQGLIADVSAAGVQHDAAVGTHFQGAPLVNSNGEVVAVASRTFSPLGFSPEAVFFAPMVDTACEQVVRCPDGDPNAPS